MDKPLDQTDWRIIAELQRDGRLSYNQLGRRVLKNTTAEDLPEVTEVHKLGASSCSILKVRVANMRHLEGLLERLGEHGENNCHIVLSTQFEGRPISAPDANARPVAESVGWSRWTSA